MRAWSKQIPTVWMRGARRGFTLIEILIVGAIISLFAGLAVISAQQMYESNFRKALFDECKSVGTALAMAQQDIGFYPRISALGEPLELITWGPQNEFIRPSFDVYGTLLPTQMVGAVKKGWSAPYTKIVETRRLISQGQKLLVRMRLPEQLNISFPKTSPMGDISLVDWPADKWGNPYMLYAVVTDAALMQQGTNPRGLRLINSAGETPNYWTAVVSYGPNGVPGGNREIEISDPVAAAYRQNVLLPARLYVDGDVTGGGAVKADYTLKSFRGTGPTQFDANFNELLAKSMNSESANTSEIGIRDDGSDDIFWVF